MTQIRCYCGGWNDIEETDLGFEEFECGFCGTLIYVPETFEEVTAANDELNETLRETAERNILYRVMVEDETGSEFCARNHLPNDDLLDLIVDGYRARYPEARRVFTEPEENFHRMLWQDRI